MKTIKIVINECSECPYYSDGKYNIPVGVCKITQTEVEFINNNVFPIWCPFEDNNIDYDRVWDSNIEILKKK